MTPRSVHGRSSVPGSAQAVGAREPEWLEVLEWPEVRERLGGLTLPGGSCAPAGPGPAQRVHGTPPGRPSSDSGQPSAPAPVLAGAGPAAAAAGGAAASGRPGTSGSRNGRFSCTGPGKRPSAPDAAAHARQASDRQ